MSRVRYSPTVAPSRARRDDAGSAGEFRWEQIMVQITFAFVIILGYLLTSRVEETRNLGERMRQQELEAMRQTQRGNLLQGVVEELRHTELGDAVAGRVAAEKASQLDRLLRVWAELRADRPLYRLLRKFENADTIPLADDPDCLPTPESFAQMNREASRVFFVPGEEVAVHEVNGIVIDVIELAGFNPHAESLGLDPTLLSEEASDLHFDKDLPTRETLRTLKLQVVADLEAERTELHRIQCKLVGRIAEARRDKLAAAPLPESIPLEADSADLGTRMLLSVLQDLQEKMKLLPETIDRIHPAGGTTYRESNQE
jgi:hypothetical protein